MIEQIMTGIYRVEIPIPGNPLGTANSYLIKGRDRDLVIDTGLGEPESMRVMQEALGRLDVDLARTDFFLTHLHPDHFGLVSDLAGENALVYLNQREMRWLDVADRPDDFLAFARLHGFPVDDLATASGKFGVLATCPRRDLGFHALRKNDVIDIGDMQLRCIETPGHTRGHLCLFEQARKIFLAGDHILPAISPVLEFMEADGWEPLREYMASLDEVRGMDIGLVLPGHGNPFGDHHGRIDELKTHHERKLRQVVSFLKSGEKTAFELTSLMVRSARASSWDLSPVLQKIIAVGETVAHLLYLEEDGDVTRRKAEDHIMYSLESNGN